VLAVLIGAAVGLAVAGLPDLDPPPARPVVEAADDETTSTVEPSEPSVSSDAPTTTVAESTTTSAVSTSTTTTAPARTTTTTDGGPEVVLSGVRVDVINSGSRGGTATAVAERLADEFGAEATAGDGPSLPTSYVAATPDLRRAAEVVAFLLGIDDIEFGALDGPARLEVFLGRDYRE
jgi:hypothetical protein